MPIGIWSEHPAGARWKNEGVARVIGFLVEGAAVRRNYAFHLVVGPGLADEVRDDLRGLAAEEFVDWVVHAPTPEQEQRFRAEAEALNSNLLVDNVAMALFANAHVPVEGWIVPFPHFNASSFLTQSKAVLVPDTIPYDFPFGWMEHWGPDAFWTRWRESATELCASADAVINFSQHVGRRRGGPLLGIPQEKVHVVPVAAPDLATELPFVRGRKRSQSSREQAAAILRDHAAEQGLTYLRNFPFEECDFVVDATQDRPTKNLGLTIDAVERIVRLDRRPLKLFMTAMLHFGENWTRLPGFMEQKLFNRDFAVLHNLPRQVHAAMFHAAAVTVHASFFEGIIGCLPFFESVSVGTPCLFANGPHTEELLETEPDMAPFIFDPYDTEGLRSLITKTIDSRDDALRVQAEICARIRRWTWADTADGYVEAALVGRNR